MRRLPAPSSTPLSTEGRRDASAPGFTPDQPSSLLPAPDSVPSPVSEESVDELPPPPLPSVRCARTYCLHQLCLSGCPAGLQGSTTDLHGLAKGSSGFCTALQSSIVVLRDLQLHGCFRFVADLRNSGSARDGLLAVHLNSGSAGDGLRAAT
ncbi:hypothetical protein CRENBAI_003860 [Crenichthys baileyi]|uniref:Uncharacterized protein n=1 Tax=Crenichthys baileyi TaxID=28760 RepID=A0AAV9SQK0_9TELE